MREINIDELLYEITGNTSRSLFWRLRMKFKFWYKRQTRKVEAKKETRLFLHADLREARNFSNWHMEKKGYMDLRYQTPTGQFVARRYKVRYHGGYMILTEMMFNPPEQAKKTKGVLTFKLAEHSSSEFHCLGLVRCKEFWIPVGTCI